MIRFGGTTLTQLGFRIGPLEEGTECGNVGDRSASAFAVNEATLVNGDLDLSSAIFS